MIDDDERQEYGDETKQVTTTGTSRKIMDKESASLLSPRRFFRAPKSFCSDGEQGFLIVTSRVVRKVFTGTGANNRRSPFRHYLREWDD
jgi:hypothetical protein